MGYVTGNGKEATRRYTPEGCHLHSTADENREQTKRHETRAVERSNEVTSREPCFFCER
jgi:hypothetical protein